MVGRFVTPAELAVLALRFGEGLDLKAVARRLGRAASTVYEASAAAMKKLHAHRFELLRALCGECSF